MNKNINHEKDALIHYMYEGFFIYVETGSSHRRQN